MGAAERARPLGAAVREEDRTMIWTTPSFEEIDLGCEIGSYSNAEL
jgi:coenzyme PQQ precursor peptide PqqA